LYCHQIGFPYGLCRQEGILVGAITLLCMLGAYSDGANSFNIWVALIAGMVASLMKLANIPLGPAILGLVLGGQMESALSNSLSISGGNWLVFIDVRHHPLSAAMIAIAILMWVVPVVRHWQSRVPARTNQRQP
ncbi:MAG: tripartite tricarboxylate transporter permease, partial [Gammaproteobacteria bacterium]